MSDAKQWSEVLLQSEICFDTYGHSWQEKRTGLDENQTSIVLRLITNSISSNEEFLFLAN